MNIIELLKRATKLINRIELSDTEKNELKDILCFLSEWRKNDSTEAKEYPQLDFILYNASRKLRTFGYNRLNRFTNEIINENDVFSTLKDQVVDELYRTQSDFVLDKAQKDVLDAFEENGQKLFLSAPTSFGKTFLLKEIIYRHHKKYENIVIVLPTVALLMEVTEDMEEFNNRQNLGYSLYNSIYRDLNISSRNIFILTPERVLRLLAILPDIDVDFFFFDEIYKIDEDISIESEEDISNVMSNEETVNNNSNKTEHRAVAFCLALYFLLKRCNACYLAGPFISLKNVGHGFKEMLERHQICPFEITFSPTLKNEIDYHGKTFIQKSFLGETKESTQSSKPVEKLVFLTNKLGFSYQNQAIVYCLYPATTEKIARQYVDLIQAPDEDFDETKAFIEHLQKNYNFSIGEHQSLDKWDFLYALKRKIGIHNGKFPKYFQREIMQLFNNRCMNVLFCTSTIVEGVNTNAKTVIVYNNPSGKTPEGKRFLLLNINGRAGRYLHHFVGNIVYLNKKTIALIDGGSISLDFKPYNKDIALQSLDLENIEDADLSETNRERKSRLNFDKNLLPDSVFEQNRLIERKKQEGILKIIIKRVNIFRGIENASPRTFVNSYFENILKIWAEIGEIKESQIFAIKSFANNYAQNSYPGVLKYAFDKYSDDMKEEPQEFVNKTYRTVFRNVKDTIEYQLPRIISLFEALINRAFEIKGIQLKKTLDLSPIVRYFEIGASTLLGTDMIEHGVPIITVKKVEKNQFQSEQLIEQRQEFKQKYRLNNNMYDRYEKAKIISYIDKYCQ